MMKIYFDDVLINEDAYAELTNEYKLFNDSFYLGSVASNTFKLKVLKSAISSHPSEVLIDDGITTFHLVVDKVEEDKGFYNYSLTDKMVNFNFNYDASTIIQTKTALEETCYLSDIWKDMCSQAGVDYDDTYTFLNDIEVTWYDNTIPAREYLSFIAELEGGYACINELGKLTIKQHKQASKKSITTDEISELIIGEKKIISRVVYDNGIDKWEFGDDTGSTLYLDNTNVFITTESMVEEIYDLIVDFEFYIVEVPDAPMDSNVRAGDIITFTDGINNYPTIAQYSTSYFGDWVGGYKLEVKTDKQEETKVLGQKEIIKKIQTEIDRTNASLNITAEQTDENSSSLADLTIESNKIATTVSSLDSSINGEEELDENLIILSDGNTTINGLTITTENNSITINGTATIDTYYELNSVFFDVSKYLIDGLFGNLKLVIKNLDEEELYNSGNGYFEVTDEFESENIKLFIPKDATFNNENLNINLAKATNEGGILENINTIKEALETVNSTMMTQTATAFEMLFTQTGIQNTVNSLQELIDGNTEDLNKLSHYIRFEGAKITLGKSDSQASLIIANDRISFMIGTNESAYITGNQLYITDSTILRKLQVGHWVTEEDSYGNLNTKWVGEE